MGKCQCVGSSLLFLSSLSVDLLEPRNLRVSDEWYTRFRVSWDAVPARVNGYNLVYTPVGKRQF